MKTIFIGISGKMQSGKDTIADDICNFYRRKCCKVIRTSFATPLKAVVRNFFGASDRNINGSVEDKTKKLSCGYTARELMQRIGTECFRSLYADAHVCACRNFIQEELSNLEYVGITKTVVLYTDVRFPNEVDYILHENAGFVIRLKRRMPGSVLADTHLKYYYYKMLYKYWSANPHYHESEILLDRTFGKGSRNRNLYTHPRWIVVNNQNMSLSEQERAVISILPPPP